MTDRKTDALRLALEALELCLPDADGSLLAWTAHAKAVVAIREALEQRDPFSHLSDADLLAMQPSAMEQPQQEPIGWLENGPTFRPAFQRIDAPETVAWSIPLYTTPPRREWVSLTAAEIFEMRKAKEMNPLDFARAIEAELKEKNHD